METPADILERQREKFSRFDLDGCQLALHLTNTTEYRGTAREHDWLSGYADDIGWAERVGILAPPDSLRLLESAARESEQAAAVHQAVKETRDVLYRIFNAIIDDAAVRADDWAFFNRRLQAALSRAKIATGPREAAASREAAGPPTGWPPDPFQWVFPDVPSTLDGFLQPVLKAAADLLVGAGLPRLRRCADPECGWIFLDVSKNNSRRWCSMSSCGNRAKARRHYRKIRTNQTTE